VAPLRASNRNPQLFAVAGGELVEAVLGPAPPKPPRGVHRFLGGDQLPRSFPHLLLHHGPGSAQLGV